MNSPTKMKGSFAVSTHSIYKTYNIRDGDIQRWVRQVILHITINEGYPVTEVRIQGKRTWANRTRTGIIRIQFSPRTITNIWNCGYREYKRILPIWAQHGYFDRLYGLLGIWAAVLHEIAHVPAWLTNEKPHGYEFKQRLNYLLTMYPLEDLTEL